MAAGIGGRIRPALSHGKQALFRTIRASLLDCGARPKRGDGAHGMSFSWDRRILEQSIDSAGRWLLASVGKSNWTTNDRDVVTSIYKLPLALNLLGATSHLATLAAFIRTHLVDGDRLVEPDDTQEYLTFC